MRILLLNTNPVVSKLVRIAVDNQGGDVEEVKHLSHVTRFHYDAILIDDAVYTKENEALLDSIDAPIRIFFSSKTEGDEIGEAFDTVLKKPFLPSQVESYLKSIREDATKKTDSDEEDTFYFMVDDEEQEHQEHVLDETEVARIKTLLEESERKIDDADISFDDEMLEARKVQVITENLQKEGLDIVDEASIVKELATQKRDITTISGEDFFEILTTMKTKKLKKLLKGAKVTLTVEFGED